MHKSAHGVAAPLAKQFHRIPISIAYGINVAYNLLTCPFYDSSSSRGVYNQLVAGFSPPCF